MPKGFTLIELVLVIAILTILAGAMVPIINANRAGAMLAMAETEVDAVRSAALMYHADTGVWPTDIATRLIANGNAAAGWNGPYIDQAGDDPWENAYVLLALGADTNLWAQSLGPDEDDDSCTDVACDDGDCDVCILITPAR